MNSHETVYAVIMAGGVGSRFWPRSRERSPKQFLEIVGNGTMIQNTVRRLSGFVEAKNIFVVTNRIQRAMVVSQLPEIPAANVIVEPVGRNTAPCIGVAGLFIERLDPKGVMVVLPADHVIGDEKEFINVLNVAARVARSSSGLVTIGIKPTHPETGYGYIQIREGGKEKNPLPIGGVYEVKTFAEKPNLPTAQKFVESGDFFWNSGMFIWRVDVILTEIKKNLPELSSQLDALRPSIGTPAFEKNFETMYGLIRGISIDYGVMEKAVQVYLVKGDFGWNDLGSWDEVSRIAPKDDEGNTKHGTVFSVKTKNSFIYSEGKVVAAVGLEDLIVINTADAVLICRKGESQNVKEIVEHLKLKQLNDYL